MILITAKFRDARNYVEISIGLFGLSKAELRSKTNKRFVPITKVAS